MEATAAIRELPPFPYKGLGYYNPADEPLFAGRSTSVRECASLIARDSTRILILHGNTACGKSSFLRAGLIPYLQSKFFHFETLAESQRAIFVTSTHEPLRQLAGFIFDLSTRGKVMETDEGAMPLDFSAVLAKQGDPPTRDQFIIRHGDSAEKMLDLLSMLATRIAQRFVVVIDQAEEILTLKPGPNGDRERDEFFRFIDLFSKHQIPIKILMAMRSEYFGRFQARSRKFFDDPVNGRDYYLGELSEGQMVEAIIQPTLESPLPGYSSSPRSRYGFVYERGLPQRIAKDLKKTFSAGGALPVMQIVCTNLFKAARNKPAIIRTYDYESGGRLEGQIVNYVDQVLKEMCDVHGVTGDADRFEEMERWKEVLTLLVRSEPDGSVTTKVKPKIALESKAGDLGCRVPFAKAGVFLASAERRVLKNRSVYRVGSGKEIECYSLGHDAIGLVLRRWWALRKETQKRIKLERQKGRTLLGFRVAVAVLGLTLVTIGLVARVLSKQSLPWVFGLVGEGLFLALIAILPRIAWIETASEAFLSKIGETLPSAVEMVKPIITKLGQFTRLTK